MTEEERERIRKRVVLHLQLQEGDELERDVEVLVSTDILWCAWECDYQAVLYRQRPDGQPELCVLGGVTVAPDGLLETLQERIAAYRKAIRDTEVFVARAKRLPPPQPGREWRWCCALCGTEGKDGEPKACPTCGATDAWYCYSTTSDDTQPAMERLRNLLEPKAGGEMMANRDFVDTLTLDLQRRLDEIGQPTEGRRSPGDGSAPVCRRRAGICGGPLA